MHYANTQQLADAEMDPAQPVNGSDQATATNPFVPNNGQTPAYTGYQAWLVPVSMGYLPNPGLGSPPYNSSCAIMPYEGVNLNDGTQRHFSIDWNTNLQGPTVNNGVLLAAHVTDLPQHTPPTSTNPAGSNTAGSENRMRPNVSCENPPETSTCGKSPDPSYATPAGRT
jgi:hypothetical protein